ncbi:UNVERIFIED_CONTAM: hypothetical protein FKN15_035731 [Acipenser sinensis]
MFPVPGMGEVMASSSYYGNPDYYNPYSARGKPEALPSGLCSNLFKRPSARMGKRRMWGPSAPAPRNHIQGSLRPSHGSPRRGPVGLWPQTNPFAQHQLQYWHNCTSDSCVLATAHTGYALQFHSGPPPFQEGHGHICE